MPSSSEEARELMIDGLKLTITGEELRSLLDRRIDSHRRSADHWKREQERTPDQQPEDEPLLPDHICANEAERYEWRAEVIEFIRDHIDVSETYRLGEEDSFGELLPDKPGWLEQDEYEERTSQGLRAMKSLRIPWLVQYLFGALSAPRTAMRGTTGTKSHNEALSGPRSDSSSNGSRRPPAN